MATREEDFVEHLVVSSTHDYILIFTSQGRLFWLKVYDLPEVGANAKGKAIVNLIKLGQHETVRALLHTRDFPEDESLMFATRNGIIKKTVMSAYGNVRDAALQAVGIEPDDELESVKRCQAGKQVFMATRKGLCIRFDEADARPMGRRPMA